MLLFQTHFYTHVAPVIDGSPLYSNIKYYDVAGLDIDRALLDFLDLSNHESQVTRTLTTIKHSSCFVSNNKLYDLKNNEKFFTLPDGNKIEMSKGERFYAPEVLFNPEMLGNDVYKNGLQGVMNESFQKCSVDNRRTLYENIVLTGGSSKLIGIEERLKLELEKLYRPQSSIPKIDIKKDFSMYLPWIGASCIAGLSSFDKMVVTKQDYDESGFRVLGKRFLTGK